MVWNFLFLGDCGLGADGFACTVLVDMKLWEQGLPNTNGRDGGPERQQDGIYTPEIRVFLPDSAKATGRIILACPGGGYSFIALGHEGYDWAPHFNEMGIAYAVLKYRLPFGHPEVPVSDAQEAIRVIRRHAAAWRINPLRHGNYGFFRQAGVSYSSGQGALRLPSISRYCFILLFQWS